MRRPIAENDRVAIGRGMRDPAGADAAGRAGYVFDDNGLTKRVLHALGQNTRQRVPRPTGRERHA
jgi:hypothetical protein